MPPLNISKMAKDVDEKADSGKASDPPSILLLQDCQQAQESEIASPPGTTTTLNLTPQKPDPPETCSSLLAPLETVPEVQDERDSSQDVTAAPSLDVTAAPSVVNVQEDEGVSSDDEKGEERELVSKKPSLKVHPIRTRPLPSMLSIQTNHNQAQNESNQANQDGENSDDEEEDEVGELDYYNDKWDPELELDPNEIVEPPDGGYGWVIVATSFLCNVVVDGIAYSFGILFHQFQTYYQSSTAKTSWVGSLLSGCYLIAGPLVSALTNRFGCRSVTIAGSIVACIAFILSTFAPTVDILMLTYGIMGGIGFGMIYLPAIVNVTYYFSTKRAFATGIAVCGSGVGAFVLAPVCEKLLEIYDWKGVVLIMAGLSLNCVVFGALMRPLEVGSASPPSRDGNKPLLQRIAEEKERLRHASLCNSQFFLVQHADGTVEKRAKILMNMEPGVHSTLNLDQFGKSPVETPIVTLSPIEEVRKSPAGSRDGESSSEEKLSKPDPPESVMAQPTLTISTAPAVQVQTPNGGSVHQLTTPGIREIAKRKGLLHSNGGSITGSRIGGMKISVSNITVNAEGVPHRKTSVPNSCHLSSSGYLCPGNRNNNYLVEEVWKKLQQEEGQVPLDGSKPVQKRPTKKDFARPMYRKDIFYSGSILNLPEYNSSKDVRSYMTSVISIPRDVALPSVTGLHETREDVDGAVNIIPTQGCCAPCMDMLPKSMTDTMKETLNFTLLKDPVFLLICISNIFGMLGFYIPYVFINNSSQKKGIPSDQAAFLLSIMGITNTIGRLFYGWLSDRPFVDALLVNNVSLALSGICIMFIPICNTYPTLVVACVLFGLFISAYICLTSIILVELMGLDRLTSAYGLLSLFRGAASIVGPPIAGSIFDLTGSYDLPFFISGSLLVFSAVLSFMVPCVQRYIERKDQDNYSEKGDLEEGDADSMMEENNSPRPLPSDKTRRRFKTGDTKANQIVSVV